ncbi:hypothetical protein [Streptomyces sp. SID3343]|nr:hypothetical protein [Streptomyces sp. SID3343]
MCPDTGPDRHAVPGAQTTVCGPDLHEYRRASPTHLGEAGASL